MTSGVDLGTVGRLLIVGGLALAGLGVVVLLFGRTPFLGRLPGDIVIRRGPVTIYAPLVTSILLSILLTIALSLFLRR